MAIITGAGSPIGMDLAMAAATVPRNLSCWKNPAPTRTLGDNASNDAGALAGRVPGKLTILPMNDESKVGRTYNAKSIADQQATYDEWAMDYERDLFAVGVRTPFMCSAIFSRFVPESTRPILDAGCGTGMQCEALALLGYGPIVGIDLSEQMLNVARGKEIYSELHRMTLGETLAFSDDKFSAVICSGVITPGHAPASSFHELIRVAKPGALIVFSLRDDQGQLPEYREVIEQLVRSGRWSRVFCTGNIIPCPTVNRSCLTAFMFIVRGNPIAQQLGVDSADQVLPRGALM